MKKIFPIKKNNRYINPHTTDLRRNVKDVILWQLGYFNDKTLPIPMPDDFSYPSPKEKLSKGEPKVTWLGHSTFLLEIDGIHILTDPVWYERCSPLGILGPKRRHPMPIELDDLPPIDFVIVSHNHYDHLDKRAALTIQKNSPHVTWVIPEGLHPLFAKWGILKVIELSWWENKKLSLYPIKQVEVSITAVPAQHFSGRSGFDTNKTLWAGFVFEFFKKGKEPRSFYFVGDTGYNDHDFKSIGHHFQDFDLSLIPIGTYVPRRFMSPVHIEPKHAAQIHSEVGSKKSVGMHWNTFRLSSEPMHRPPYDLFLALKEQEIDPHTFRVLRPGQVINW